MSKNIEKFNGQNKAPQGNSRFNFLWLNIMLAATIVFTEFVFNTPPPKSAGSPVPADCNFKNHSTHTLDNGPAVLSLTAGLNLPAKSCQNQTAGNTHAYSSPLTNLPGGSSSPPDRGFLTADYADYKFSVNSVVEKLLILESNGKLNPAAGDNGNAIGPLQLHLCVLLDVNKYYGVSFKPDDRKDLAKSKQLAAMYIAMWLPRNGSTRLTTEEIAVRIFNGGPRGWRSEATDKYYKKYLTTKNTK